MKHTSPAQARTKRYYSRRYNMIGMARDQDLERLEEWARRRDRRQRAWKYEKILTEIHYQHHPELRDANAAEKTRPARRKSRLSAQKENMILTF